MKFAIPQAHRGVGERPGKSGAASSMETARDASRASLLCLLCPAEGSSREESRLPQRLLQEFLGEPLPETDEEDSPERSGRNTPRVPSKPPVSSLLRLFSDEGNRLASLAPLRVSNLFDEATTWARKEDGFQIVHWTTQPLEGELQVSFRIAFPLAPLNRRSFESLLSAARDVASFEHSYEWRDGLLLRREPVSS